MPKIAPPGVAEAATGQIAREEITEYPAKALPTERLKPPRALP